MSNKENNVVKDTCLNTFELLITDLSEEDDSIVSSLASSKSSSAEKLPNNKEFVTTEEEERTLLEASSSRRFQEEMETFQPNINAYRRFNDIEDGSIDPFSEKNIPATKMKTSHMNFENSNGLYYYPGQNNSENEDQSIAKSEGTTIQLSLPDSIDYSFNLYNMSDRNIRKEPKNDTKSKTAFLKPSNKEARKARNPSYSTNALRTKCVYRNSIAKIVQDLYDVAQPINEETYQRVRSIPLKKRSLKEEITLLIYHHILFNKSNKDISSNNHGINDNKQQAAVIEQLKNELSTSENRQNDAELKLHELQNDSLSWKDKARQFDQMSNRADNAEKEVAKLKSLIENQANNLKEVKEEENDSKNKCKELERKVVLLDMNHALTKKENQLLLERIEYTEKEKFKINIAFQEAQQKRDDVLEELSQIHERNAKTFEDKLSNERSRIREECMKEMSIVSKNSNEVWERETKLLRESKNEALNELEKVKNEFSDLRSNYEKIIFQNSKLTAERDGVVEGLQNEVKTKEIEHSKIASSNEVLTADLRAANLQNDHMRDQVLIHEKKFTKLEEAAKSEQAQLQQELNLKSNELDLYQKTEMQSFMYNTNYTADDNNELDEGLICSEYTSNSTPTSFSVAAAVSKRYKQQIYQLTEKYKSLQTNYRNINEKLQKEQKTNEIIQSKYESIERMMQSSLSGPSNYIVQSMNDLEQEVCRLSSENQNLRKDTDSLKVERDSLAKESTIFSETRKQFNDLKELVKALKKDGNDDDTSRNCGKNYEVNNAAQLLKTPTLKKKLFGSCNEVQHHGGISAHLTHHRDRGVIHSPSWHSPNPTRKSQIKNT